MQLNLGVDDPALTNKTVKFIVTATLNDILGTNNSDLSLVINFVAVPLSKILEQNTAPYFSKYLEPSELIPCSDSDEFYSWNFTFPQVFDDQYNTFKFHFTCSNVGKYLFVINQH